MPDMPGPTPPDRSSTKARAFDRSTWRRNLWPSPLFCEAPLIRPGMSATASDELFVLGGIAALPFAALFQKATHPEPPFPANTSTLIRST
ncbi:MAG: hypothetical protein FRX49_10470 [Trebouxia sp. A1-2]|nr:MAG: hypothetical protein FRX49_10470 [Trebouxia sp. A1-2]